MFQGITDTESPSVLTAMLDLLAIVPSEETTIQELVTYVCSNSITSTSADVGLTHQKISFLLDLLSSPVYRVRYNAATTLLESLAMANPILISGLVSPKLVT